MLSHSDEYQTHPAGRLGFYLSLISAGLIGGYFLYTIILALVEHNREDGIDFIVKWANVFGIGTMVVFCGAFVLAVFAAWKCVVGWKHAPRGWGDRQTVRPFLMPAVGLLISASVLIYVPSKIVSAALSAQQFVYQLPWLQTSSALDDLRIRASINEVPASLRVSYREELSDGTEIGGYLRTRSLSEEEGEALVNGQNDAWGNEILYRRVDEETFLFISLGPDGTIDTEDDLASSNDIYLDTRFNFPWIEY